MGLCNSLLRTRSIITKKWTTDERISPTVHQERRIICRSQGKTMHTIPKSSTAWQSKMNGETSSIVMGTVSLQEDLKDYSQLICSAVSNFSDSVSIDLVIHFNFETSVWWIGDGRRQ